MHYDYETCDELDCQLCLGIKAKEPIADAGKLSFAEEIADVILGAVQRLNDKIETNKTAPVDLSAIQAQIDAQAQINQDKLNTLVVAIADKLKNLPASDTTAIMDAIAAQDNMEQAKLDDLALAIDAKLAALKPDTSALEARMDAQAQATDTKFDDIALAIQAKLDAIPQPDLTQYSTTEDAQAYADTGDSQTLTDASEYADAADALLAEKIAQSHDDLVNLIIDHAVPAAAVAAAAAMDPKVIDQAKLDIAALQKADTLQAATAVTGSKAGVAAALTLWTGTKVQYDALTLKDPGTVYLIQ